MNGGTASTRPSSLFTDAAQMRDRLQRIVDEADKALGGTSAYPPSYKWTDAFIEALAADGLRLTARSDGDVEPEKIAAYLREWLDKPDDLNVFDPTGTEAIRVALIDTLACAAPHGLCGVCREEVEHALRELDKIEAGQ